MFVEGPCKVTVHELIIIDSLSNDTSHKLEVAQMVAITV